MDQTSTMIMKTTSDDNDDEGKQGDMTRHDITSDEYPGAEMVTEAPFLHKKKHSKTTLGGTPSQVPKITQKTLCGHFQDRTPQPPLCMAAGIATPFVTSLEGRPGLPSYARCKSFLRVPSQIFLSLFLGFFLGGKDFLAFFLSRTLTLQSFFFRFPCFFFLSFSGFTLPFLAVFF